MPIEETLFGKTVFVLGFRATGSRSSLRPFGVKILATKRNWASVSMLANDEVDYLIDQKETIGIIKGRFLSSIKGDPF